MIRIIAFLKPFLALLSITSHLLSMVRKAERGTHQTTNVASLLSHFILNT